MFTAFSALNESSNADGRSDDSSAGDDADDQVLEFEDDDYIRLYNSALASYGEGKWKSAESKFRNLAESDYIRHCGHDSYRPRNVASKLQFNSLRYLGLCLAQRQAYDECLERLEDALRIDGTDVTLYFRFAIVATKAGQLHYARSALEVAMQKYNGPGTSGVRHWPSLDLLVSLTYKMNDYLGCLRYIEFALQNDPNYSKGTELRRRIYEEYPFLDPDPANQNKPVKIRPVLKCVVARPKTPPPNELKLSELTFVQLAQCIAKEYEACGETDKLLDRCSVLFQSPVQEEEELMEVDEEEDNEARREMEQIIVELLEKVVTAGSEKEVLEDEPMEEEEEEVVIIEREQTESEAIVGPIVDQLLDNVETAVTKDFLYKLVEKLADNVVGESEASQSPPPAGNGTRRKLVCTSFLNEVPFDLIEKRRSSRVNKGASSRLGDNSDSLLDSSPRGEETTAKSLLESYLPDSLLEDFDNEKTPSCSPEKKRAVPMSPKKNVVVVASKNLSQKWLDQDEEAKITQSLVDSTFQNMSIIDVMPEFLVATLKHAGQDRLWPRPFQQAFVKIYLCWRRHFVLPDEFHSQDAHPYIPSIMIANEVILRDALEQGIDMEEEDEEEDEEVDEGESDEDEEEEKDKVKGPMKYVFEDLQHLVLNIFRVKRADSVRILSLHLHYYGIKGKIPEAMGISDKLIPFYEELQSEAELVSPVDGYQVFKRNDVDAFLESQKHRNLISQVNELYEKRDYAMVKDILSANLTTSKRKSDPSRLYHLCMMIDSLWNLDEYSDCMWWTELAIHELTIESSGSENDTSADLLNLLKTLDCCIVMLDGDMSGIDKRSRLAKHLLDLVLGQVEGKEDCGLGIKTVLPWSLLYKLIAFEERSIDEFEDNIPGSLNFLCSAHDYLGPLSLCTSDDGQLLVLIVEKVVETLFKGVPSKSLADQLCKNLDQSLYCLYAHPSKKSKVKHLVDHGISNVALTWERCTTPYLYLRPKKLPEYDDLRSASVFSETVVFLRRIVALVPDEYEIVKRDQTVKDFMASNSDDAKLPVFEAGKGVPVFPAAMLDLFYLLGDYYFKNNEFPTALKFYRTDLSFNSRRLDSWVALALSLVNGLEMKVNEMEKVSETSNKIIEMSNEVVKQILNEAEAIMKCFRTCLQLAPRCTTVRIESANFAYMMLSFCSRQLDNADILSMDLFNLIEKLKPSFQQFALDNYNRALEISEEKQNKDRPDDEEEEHDERWLLHMMKGKIMEKQKKPVAECLSQYMKALDNLILQGAVLPRKINFNSPPELALELLEVYYRIHATVIKLELSGEAAAVGKDTLKQIKEILNRVDSASVMMAIDNKTKDSETDSCDPPPEKVAKLDAAIMDSSGGGDKEEDMWSHISASCTKALEVVIGRFPQHFKALHQLSVYYLKSKRAKDIRKVKRYMWGTDNTSSRANVSALFGERKANNFFNGIWRLPLSEVDRAGSFSTHMAKCVNTLLELAVLTKDHTILLEAATQLRKPPDNDRKYLFEKQRRGYAQQAYTGLKKVLRQKVDDLINKGAGSSEARLALLLEIYQIYTKLRRTWQTRDDSITSLMVELYKAFGASSKVSFEEVNTFCMRALHIEKTSAASTSSRKHLQGSDSNSSSQTVASLLRQASVSKDNTTATSGSRPAASASNSNQGYTQASMAAALDYVNAANYCGGLVSSLLATGGGGAAAKGYTSAETQAYLSAYAAAAASASYGTLLEGLPSSISVSRTATVSPTGTTNTKTDQRPKSSTMLSSSSSYSKPGPKSSKGLQKASVVKTNKPTSTKMVQKTSNEASSSTLGLSVSKVIVSGLSTTPKGTGVANKKSSTTSTISAPLVYKRPDGNTSSGNNQASNKNSSAAAVAAANEILMRERAMNMSKSTTASSSKSTSVTVTKVGPASVTAKPFLPSTPQRALEIKAKPFLSQTKPDQKAVQIIKAKQFLQKPSTSFMHQRPTVEPKATMGSHKSSAAQDALAKLKSFRTTLPKALKKNVKPTKPTNRPNTTMIGAHSMTAVQQSKPTTITVPSSVNKSNNDDDDDDVICID